MQCNEHTYTHTHIYTHTHTLLEELKTVAAEVKKNQIEDAVGSSWAALEAEEDSQRREVRTLLVKARERGEGGRGERTGGGGWPGARGGGVLNNENYRKIRWQPSLIGRMNRARPIEGLEECAWELCPVSNQDLRAPSTRTLGRSCRISKTWKVRQ